MSKEKAFKKFYNNSYPGRSYRLVETSFYGGYEAGYVAGTAKLKQTEDQLRDALRKLRESVGLTDKGRQ